MNNEVSNNYNIPDEITLFLHYRNDNKESLQEKQQTQ
jgi:hypothetical protein